MQTHTQEAAKAGELMTLDMEPGASLPAVQQVDSFIALLSTASRSKDVDVIKLQALLDMQRQLINEKREQEWNAAMLAAQREMPRLAADKENPHTHSYFATLTNVNRTIKPIYEKHGLFLTFDSEDSPKGKDYLRVVAYCCHQNGWKKRYQHDVAEDAVGSQGNSNKTKTQAGGSSLSYGRRYLTLLIFNIAMRGEDDDGNNGDYGDLEYVSADQIANINARLDEVTSDAKRRQVWKEKLLKKLKVSNLEDILAKNYEGVLKEIAARIRQEATRPPS